LAFLNFDSGEPFGLPKGTVRGIIALGFAGTTLFLFATGREVTDALLGISTLIIGNYFGFRGSSPVVTRVIEEPLAAPATGEDG
jgi:hypothetical protein